MNKIFLVDNKHICEVPLAMREELTNKGIIPKEIDPEDTELVVFVLVRGTLSGTMHTTNTPICRGLALLSRSKTQTRRAQRALFFHKRKYLFKYV